MKDLDIIMTEKEMILLCESFMLAPHNKLRFLKVRGGRLVVEDTDLIRLDNKVKAILKQINGVGG